MIERKKIQEKIKMKLLLWILHHTFLYHLFFLYFSTTLVFYDSISVFYTYFFHLLFRCDRILYEWEKRIRNNTKGNRIKNETHIHIHKKKHGKMTLNRIGALSPNTIFKYACVYQTNLINTFARSLSLSLAFPSVIPYLFCMGKNVHTHIFAYGWNFLFSLDAFALYIKSNCLLSIFKKSFLK